MVPKTKKIKTCDKGSNVGTKEDMISTLPHDLISRILSKISTKEAVKTSVLSTKWRNLWMLVPGLDDIKSEDFADVNAFRVFLDKYFDFRRELSIKKIRLTSYSRRSDAIDTSFHTSWIHDAVERQIQHLDLCFDNIRAIEMPLSLFTSKTLVILRLCYATLVNANVVNLSCLKSLSLHCNHYPNEATLEKLISSPPVLEELLVVRIPTDNANVLKVCSPTLKRVDLHHYLEDDGYRHEVVIDAPMLEIFRFKGLLSEKIQFVNLGFSHKLFIDVSFDFPNMMDPYDLLERSMTRDFFNSISKAEHLVMSHDTSKVMYQCMNLEPLLQFCHLSQLNVGFSIFDVTMLPIILESFPKLESLILEMVGRPRMNKGTDTEFPSVPLCLTSSLKSVEFKSPILGYEGEIKLVTYLLENSTILEKMSLRFEKGPTRKPKYVILQEIMGTPRCSKACEVVFL